MEFFLRLTLTQSSQPSSRPSARPSPRLSSRSSTRPSTRPSARSSTIEFLFKTLIPLANLTGHGRACSRCRYVSAKVSQLGFPKSRFLVWGVWYSFSTRRDLSIGPGLGSNGDACRKVALFRSQDRYIVQRGPLLFDFGEKSCL